MEIISQPHSDTTLGEVLKQALSGQLGEFHTFKAAVAFVKRSGVQHVIDYIKGFAEEGKAIELVIGIDQFGTSVEGLTDLMQAIGENGRIYINHDESPYVTFHPKLYFFNGIGSSLVIVGSANMTEGGLFTNDECFTITRLNQKDAKDRAILDKFDDSFDTWCDSTADTVNLLDATFLQKLQEAGYIKPEEQLTLAEPTETGGITGAAQRVAISRLFGRSRRRRPSRPSRGRAERRHRGMEAVMPITEAEGFVMTLMRTDVGSGQTTPGTSRRSPEIFIPLSARNVRPSFWGWPDAFVEDQNRPGKFDRMNVRIHFGGRIVSVNMMTWPVKHDFRLRCEALRSAGDVGDILRIEKADGTRGFDYFVSIIPQGTAEFEYFQSLCENAVRGSNKKWGYY